MGIILLVIAAVLAIGLQITPKGIRPDYISLPNTTAIKGFFVIWVFLRHFKGYVSLERAIDQPFLLLDRWMGQMVVVMFLFYSGYGLYESFQKKGAMYVRTIPKKRILATLLHFDLAVIAYWIIAWCSGTSYTIGEMAASLVAWKSVGNSNWFIFVILLLYLFSWAALRFIPSKPWQIVAVAAMSGAYALWYHLSYPDYWWWYDTVFCFAAGMAYSLCREKIEKLLSKEIWYWIALCSILIMWWFLFQRRSSIAVYEVLAVVTCLMIVLISMKIHVGNRLLLWFGRQVFTVYILQRIPLNILGGTALANRPYLFFLVTFAATIGLAAAFDKLLKKFDKTVLKIGG